MINCKLESINGRYMLRFECKLAYSVGRVWQAVSNPVELKQWYPAPPSWTPKAGESLESYGEVINVFEVEEPRRLAWTGDGDKYSFALIPDDGTCVLTFSHTFDNQADAAKLAAGWETYLVRLEAHLRGDFIDEPTAHRSWGERHERLAKQLGIDPAPGRKFWSESSASHV